MAYDQNIRRLPDPYYQNGIGFASASIKPVPTGTSHPLNGGGTVSVAFAGGYWEIDISYPDTLQHELDTVLPFLDSLEGSFNPFYILLPQYRYPKTGPWDTSTSAKIAEGDIELVSAKSIRITSWSTRGGDLSPGDMFKFTNSGKVYRITSKDYNSSNDTVTFELNTLIKYPSLVATAGFEVNDLLFRVELKGNTTPSPRLQANGIYSGFSLSMRETTANE
jgi:hypothetical protein